MVLNFFKDGGILNLKIELALPKACYLWNILIFILVFLSVFIVVVDLSTCSYELYYNWICILKNIKKRKKLR